MASQVESILKDAMSLPANERLDIAERLLETLEPGDEDVADAEKAAELQRRSDELKKDPTAGIPWETLRDEM